MADPQPGELRHQRAGAIQRHAATELQPQRGPHAGPACPAIHGHAPRAGD
ncbi:hypothetical protein [Komagataeibacter rhaeticus]|nr:hypothetical protein [Komagataeibacter rhaeticus]